MTLDSNLQNDVFNITRSLHTASTLATLMLYHGDSFSQPLFSVRVTCACGNCGSEFMTSFLHLYESLHPCGICRESSAATASWLLQLYWLNGCKCRLCTSGIWILQTAPTALPPQMYTTDFLARVVRRRNCHRNSVCLSVCYFSWSPPKRFKIST